MSNIKGKSRQELLTPDHQRWSELKSKLNEILFTYIDNKLYSRCKGDLRYSIRILKSMGNIDVEKTLKFFRKHHGYCDCEILFNVEDCWQKNFNVDEE
jgi:hypothetical protein